MKTKRLSMWLSAVALCLTLVSFIATASGAVIGSDLSDAALMPRESARDASGSVETYGLWIGGAEVTSENLTIDRYDDPDISSGSAVFNPETHTLTLNDFHYKGIGHYYDNYGNSNRSALFYDGENDLTIVLNGNSEIIQTGENDIDYVQGMCFYNPRTVNINVSIKSTDGGMLSVTGGAAPENSCGIYANHANLTILGCEVHAAGGTAAAYSYGVSCNGCDFTLKKGRLTAEGGDAPDSSYTSMISSGIRCNRGTVYVEGETLDAVGGDSPYQSYGIYGGGNGETVSVSGGTMIAQGQRTAISAIILSPDDGSVVYAGQDEQSCKIVTTANDWRYEKYIKVYKKSQHILSRCPRIH